MVDILKPISIIMEDGQRFTGLLSLTQDENAVLIGEGAPSIPPNYTGQGYLARSTKQFYTGNNLGQWVPLSVSSSASGVFSLMSDVDFSSLQNDQQIKYVASTGKWVNFTPSSNGGGGGSTTLDGLDDVYTPNPSEGDLLGFDGLEWTSMEIGIDILSDVNLGTSSNSPDGGNVLMYTGNEWTNAKGAYIAHTSNINTNQYSVTSDSFEVVAITVTSPYPGDCIERLIISGVVGRSDPGYVYLSLESGGYDLTSPSSSGMCVVYVSSNEDLVPFSFEYVQSVTELTTYNLTMHSGSTTDTAYIGRRGLDNTIKVPTNIFMMITSNDYHVPS